MGICIAGTGRYLPPYTVTNRDYEDFLDTSDEWIASRTGIRERRISLDTPTWRMGELAAREALAAAGVKPEDIDLVLCTTVSGDYSFPSAACLIQRELGAKNAFAMDIAASCTGSVYALDMARRYLATGDADTILLIGAETVSQLTDYTERGSCILFGDGAGAAVLRAGNGAYGAALYSDPDGAEQLYCKHERKKLPFARQPAGEESEDSAAQKQGGLFMNGREVYRFATSAMPRAVRAACKKAGMAVDDLDLIIPHQANVRIIETAARLLKTPMEKLYLNLQRYGNTSSASILICLDECVREGRLKRGDKLCVVGFGAGLTYGAAALEYQN